MRGMKENVSDAGVENGGETVADDDLKAEGGNNES